MKNAKNNLAGSIRYSLAVLSLGGSILCGLASWQSMAPLTAPTLFPFAYTYVDKAIAVAGDDDVHNNERLKWADLAVKVAPARAENWTLLAYAYQMKDRGFSPRTIDALRHSYIVGPLSPDAHKWRLSYIFNNLSLLPLDIRNQAMQELIAYADRDSGLTFFKRQLLPNTGDQQGRLTLAAILISKQTQENVDYQAKMRAKAQSALNSVAAQ